MPTRHTQSVWPGQLQTSCVPALVGAPNTCELRPVRYSLHMTQMEQNVLDALLELERAVETMPRTTPKPNLLPFFSRLDDLTRTLPSTTDPLLLHYLHKKS